MRGLPAFRPNYDAIARAMQISRVNRTRSSMTQACEGMPLPRASVLLALSSALWFHAAAASDKPAVDRPEALPTAVEARYRLLYNGIGVGHLQINATASEGTYSLSGSGKVSAFFGAVSWSGSSAVSGSLEGGGEPSPTSYAFDWRHNKKGGSIKLGFSNRSATDVAVTPPPSPHPDLVPIAPAHKAGVLDPVSAVLALTKADGRPPCDRRVGIFDGKQRYDIVLTPKRMTQFASSSGNAEPAHVCRAMYEPIAGHRDNEATKTYASNRDVEVVMRRVPGTVLHVPYSVMVPTFWGTGSMITDRIDVVTPSKGRIALTR